MELQEADTLLDGGTTCLTLLDGSETKYITIDYSLPTDGRLRYVFIGKTQFSQDHQLDMNSREEKQIVNWLKSELISNFGERRIQEFIEGRISNFGEGKWLCALHFLRIITKEREYI